MKNIITKLFNLEQRKIHDIEIIHVDNEVLAIISLRKSPSKCPVCGTFTDLVHDYRKRTINHAILNNVITHLIYNRRRYRCPSCGKVFAEDNPFVSPSRRLSRFTIIRVMKMLKNPRVTFSMAANAANISTSSAIRIFDEFAGISTLAFPKVLCIDEVYTSKYRQKITFLAYLNPQEIRLHI